MRALNDAVLAALEKRDIDAAQAAARALAKILDGVDVNDWVESRRASPSV